MSPSLEIPIQDLLDVVHKSLGEHAPPRDLRITTLSGGYTALRAYRLDLISAPGDDLPAIRSFVQKYTNSAEVMVMRELAEHFNDATLPELMQSTSRIETSWFIVPYYEGEKLAFGDPLPQSIARTLASVHAFYSTRTADLGWLTPIDATYIDRLLVYIGSDLNADRARFSDSEYAELFSLLQMVREKLPAFVSVLKSLPLTLTHGDVHSGNIIQTARGSYILVDWGNARLAPRMLDIANMTPMGSDSWNAYNEAWEAASGMTLDAAAAKREYVWATAMVNMQYLPFAIAHLDANAAIGMAMKILTAIAQLETEMRGGAGV